MKFVVIGMTQQKGQENMRELYQPQSKSLILCDKICTNSNYIVKSSQAGFFVSRLTVNLVRQISASAFSDSGDQTVRSHMRRQLIFSLPEAATVSTKKSRPRGKSQGEPALVTSATLSTHVKKPILNLNACA